MVVPDDKKAPFGKGPAERIAPSSSGGHRPCDQEAGGILGIAERLREEGEGPDVNFSNFFFHE